MSRFLAAALLLFTPAMAAGQTLRVDDVNTARISVAVLDDHGAAVAGRTSIEFTQLLKDRSVISGSLALVGTNTGLNLGRSFAQWRAASSTTSVGTFFYRPQIFDNQLGSVYVPPVLVRGAETEWQTARISLRAFTANFLVEEGARILYERSTSDAMMGVTATFNVAKSLRVGAQATRLRSDPTAETVWRSTAVSPKLAQARTSIEWKPAAGTTINAEYGRTSGAPSSHVSLQQETARFDMRMAYVKRDAVYMPFGLLSAFGDRKGTHAEFRYRVTSWAELSGAAVRLRTNGSTESWQYNANATVQTPGNVQVTLGQSQSGIKSNETNALKRQKMKLSSVTIMKSFQQWITRVRAEQIDLRNNASNRTRGLAFNTTRIFRNGLSLSGELRSQHTSDASKRVTRISVGIQGGYSWRNRITLSVQTDLGRDIRNETIFATSNLKTSTASVTAKLSKSSELRIEYVGTRMNYELNPQSILAGTLLGGSVSPVIGGSNRNVLYVQFQKTFKWDQPERDLFADSTTGVAVFKPVGVVAGRVCVDENESGTCDEGESGVANVILRLENDRKTITDDDGKFQFEGVIAGPHEIAVESETLNAIYTATTLSQSIAVTARSRTTADFLMHASSSVSGRIRRRVSDEVIPVADAAIRLEPGGLYAYSDSNGEFAISNVPRGMYVASVVRETLRAADSVVSEPWGVLEIAQSGQQLTGIDFLIEHIEPEVVIERLPSDKVTVRQ